MKRFVIATFLGLFLSLPALASHADCAQQIRSHSSEVASGYVYVNRLDTPERNPVSVPASLADKASAHW
ncbi:hypothetical protein [Pantoea sp.]|uniref:hypothetical protein n=1 Tax=Pantoea sp. TaxID=69393 RepID=UPI0028B23AB2|nr:hypothetical protein [Pantoea sp.]